MKIFKKIWKRWFPKRGDIATDVECEFSLPEQRGQIDDWKKTMTPEEVKWCWEQINKALGDESDFPCCDSFRAARAWKGSQVRRFKRLRSCCGSIEWIAYKWSWKKLRFDKYILGFNYGH